MPLTPTPPRLPSVSRRTIAVLAALALLLVAAIGAATSRAADNSSSAGSQTESSSASGVGAEKRTSAAEKTTGSMVFTLGSHNIHWGDAQVDGFADVICWQEATTAESRKRIRSLPGYGTSIPSDQPSQLPVSYKSDKFKLVSAGATMFHGSGPGPANPARWMNRVLLEERTSGRLIVIYNTHWVNGAWNGKPKPGYKKWRQEAWKTAEQKMNIELNEALARDVPAFACGDFNRSTPADFDNLTPIPRGNRSGWGIDHLQYSNGSQIEAEKVFVGTNAGSDHARITSRISIPRKIMPQ